MKTPKEEYTVYPSLSVPARYGYDLHTKSKDEPIVVVCGVEEPKIHLVPSELQEFARQINEAITHDLGLESGTCEVEYRRQPRRRQHGALRRIHGRQGMRSRGI